MKYRLKDLELQQKLDEISDGDFTKCLEYKSERFAKEFDQWRCANVRVDFGKKGVTFSAILHLDDLEEVHTYDPSSWNNFPEVTPPEDVLMATEFYWSQKDFEEECPCRSCWMFKNGKWHWMDGRDCLVDYGWKNIRFRPWNQ